MPLTRDDEAAALQSADAVDHRSAGAHESGEIELEPAVPKDPKDRHVPDAGVVADSEVIVTFNLDDFPPEACEPLGVAAIQPDEFLLDLNDLDREAVRAALEQQAADLHPPWTLDKLLAALAPPAFRASRTRSAPGASLRL